MSFKIGDKVKCIGNDDRYHDKLTIGNLYTIRSITKSSPFLSYGLGQIVEWFHFEEVGNAFEAKYYEKINKNLNTKQIELKDLLKSMREFADKYPVEFKTILEHFKD